MFDGENGFLLASPDASELYVFDAAGRHTETLEPLSGAALWTFEYNQAGLLTSLTDRSGNTTTIERDTNGDPTAIVSPYGIVTELTLNPQGYLDSITNPLGHSYSFAYTEAGLLSSMIDPRGGESIFEYDDLGRLISDSDPTGATQTLEYQSLWEEDRRGFSVVHTSAQDRSTTYRREKTPEGTWEVSTSFDDGKMTQASIDADGVKRVIFSDSTEIEIARTADPRFGMASSYLSTKRISTPSGIEYLELRHQTVTPENAIDPLTVTGQVEQIEINGRIWIQETDFGTLQKTSTSPEGRQYRIRFDNLGRIVSQELLNTDYWPLEMEYDDEGNLSLIKQGQGEEARTWFVQYNSEALPSQITDPIGNVRSYEYDAAARPTSRSMNSLSPIQFGYDEIGRLVNFSRSQGPSYEFDYTNKNRLSEFIFGPEVTLWQRDADSSITEKTRPNGTKVVLARGPNGRLESVSTPEGTIVFDYDPVSQKLLSITNPSGETLEYEHDGFIVAEERWSGSVNGNIIFNVDNNLLLQSTNITGYQVDFYYDDDGFLIRSGDLAIERIEATGRVFGTTLGNVTTEQLYNQFDELHSFVASIEGDALFEEHLQRDRLGRIQSRTQRIEGVTHEFDYTYDQSNRLETVSRDGEIVSVIGYDSNSNRLSLEAEDGTVTEATYDSQDRLLTQGSANYTYTINGELASMTKEGQTTHFSYDSLGNLTTVQLHC